MKEYNAENFIKVLRERTNNKEIKCDICGGNSFTTTEQFASIIIGKDLNSVQLGPQIPAGMLICEKCGHIDFFALGALNLLNKKEN